MLIITLPWPSKWLVHGVLTAPSLAPQSLVYRVIFVFMRPSVLTANCSAASSSSWNSTAWCCVATPSMWNCSVLLIHGPFVNTDALAVDTEEVQEIRPHRVHGIGFGNIFESKPISLRPTAEKKPVPEPNHQKPAPEPIKPSMVSNWFPTRLSLVRLLKS